MSHAGRASESGLAFTGDAASTDSAVVDSSETSEGTQYVAWERLFCSSYAVAALRETKLTWVVTTGC